MEMNRVPKAEMDPSIDMNLDRTRLFTVKDERSESHENIIEDSSLTSPNGSSESKSTRKFYIESLLVNRSSDKDFVSVGCSQPVPATSHVSYDNRAPSKSSESNETKICMNNKVYKNVHVNLQYLSEKLKRKAVASTSFSVSSEMCLDPRSGYDGTFEEGCGLSTSLMEASNANKRARTIFTAEQLDKMEQEFHKQQYVVGHERMYLANALNLTEAQVRA